MPNQPYLHGMRAPDPLWPQDDDITRKYGLLREWLKTRNIDPGSLSPEATNFNASLMDEWPVWPSSPIQHKAVMQSPEDIHRIENFVTGSPYSIFDRRDIPLGDKSRRLLEKAVGGLLYPPPK